MLPVVILCGGLGTRLRPVVDDRPKVLAPVAGTPFLGHLLDHLRRQGATDVILSTGYLGEQVEAYAGDGGAWGLRLRYACEPAPLGTGGALRFAAETQALQGAFLALNGDTFFAGSLDRLLLCHGLRRATATLALARVSRPDRYGTVRTAAETGAVTAFVEKQAAPEGEAWINAGVYVLAPALVRSIPPATKVSLERDIFPRWIGRGLFGCRFPDTPFLDIGTPEDYARAPHVLHPPGDAA